MESEKESSSQVGNKRKKHPCLTCGKLFDDGRALGGHVKSGHVKKGHDVVYTKTQKKRRISKAKENPPDTGGSSNVNEASVNAGINEAPSNVSEASVNEVPNNNVGDFDLNELPRDFDLNHDLPVD